MPHVPHEGITVEFLFEPLRTILLQPVLTTALFVAIQRSPQFFADLLSQVTERVSLFHVERGLQIFIGLGLAYRGSRLLNRFALNNWTSDRTWDWNKEIVAITGGSSGIGADVVRKLSDKGIKVVSLDIQKPVDPLPKNAHFFQTDVTSPESLREVAKKVRKTVGDPTVLINNAGIGTGQTILSEDEGVLKKTMEVNTIAHFWMAREFLPSIAKNNHGHVITVASMASFVAIASNVAYSCSKASAMAFHEGLRQELKHRFKAPKVRATIVHPWWVRTPLIEELYTSSHFKSFLLSPETVADAIEEQVLKGESAQLVIPARLGWITPTVRALPMWLQEHVRDGQSQIMNRDQLLTQQKSK